MAATPTGSIVQKRALLEGARRGDDHAFGRLVGTYRPELHAHCYRMLGSVHDADDALQDTLLRAWRGLPEFDGRRPPRPWLSKSATNAGLDPVPIPPTPRLPLRSPREASRRAGRRRETGGSVSPCGGSPEPWRRDGSR